MHARSERAPRFALTGGLVALAISWHGTMPAMGQQAAGPAARPTVDSVEELLIVLEEVHGLHFRICSGPAEGTQFCTRARVDSASVRDTLQECLDNLADAPNWVEGKKKSRLRITLGKRDVVVTLHTKKRRLSIAFNPALPDCGDDPRKVRIGEYKGNPTFESPERIEGVGNHPTFPKRARVARVGGRVDALGTIDTEGRILDLCLLDVSARSYGFEAAFFNALREWRYRPATLNSETIAVSFTISTTWTIH